ncbi:unnamed protein product [Paramecium pentaurelia]|uniref:Lysozyme n=1 Tax=Paramecium pentaurelia TaxID=43138 RepID=A0A8S1W9F8_9CILI|nr:unnamed protein product [Paramecium pentaurelia]
MQQNIIIFCIISCLITTSLAVKGIDIADAFNNFTCFKNAGYQFAIIRGYRSYGAVDPNAATNMKNAQAAGLITDAYFFPCKGKITAAQQVSDFISALGSEEEYSTNGLYGTIWLDVETNPSTGCGWSSSDYTGNCNFLNDLITNFKNKGKLVGIYSSKYQWETIFGSVSACAKFTSLPLWYAHYDNNPSFSDYAKYSFGGWTTPNIKQYNGDQTVCNADVDLNFY